MIYSFQISAAGPKFDYTKLTHINVQTTLLATKTLYFLTYAEGAIFNVTILTDTIIAAYIVLTVCIHITGMCP